MTKLNFIHVFHNLYIPLKQKSASRKKTQIINFIFVHVYMYVCFETSFLYFSLSPLDSLVTLALWANRTENWKLSRINNLPSCDIVTFRSLVNNELTTKGQCSGCDQTFSLSLIFSSFLDCRQCLYVMLFLLFISWHSSGLIKVEMRWESQKDNTHMAKNAENCWVVRPTKLYRLLLSTNTMWTLIKTHHISLSIFAQYYAIKS